MKISYFGFGSLVNLKTRPDHPDARCVALSNWGRVWGHQARVRDGRQADAHGVSGWTVLSVEPRAGDSIEGVLVTIDASQLEALDLREAGYNRVELDPAELSPTGGLATSEEQAGSGELQGPVYMYVSKAEHNGHGNEEFPLLQSYVDCVMSGYQREFGAEGLQRFLATTTGWNAPMLQDRADPAYVRSVDLEPNETEKFDSLLAPLVGRII